MKNAMETLQDLIEEAKLRTVWWILCIFGVTYFLTHTSKSMLMNIPIAILFVSGMRILLNEVEFRWKVQNIRPTSYLSHLEKKQLSVNDSRLTSLPVPQKWKRKINSPMVEAAAEVFISKILQDFVVDLWYSDITPDKEAPELIHDIIMDALGEVSGRIKDVNLVDLLTRDAVDLVGEHLDLFRRSQAAIGVDVMGTLSSEERDERLKHQMLTSKELHPALISADYEYKVLQRLMGALLAVVLRPREAQSPLVRCIARELLVCLVMQPVMNFASPWYINELIECIILAYNNGGFNDAANDQSAHMESHNHAHVVSASDGKSVQPKSSGLGDSLSSVMPDGSHTHHADWAKAFDAASQRRTEVLMPENLENMWAIGRNYKKRIPKGSALGTQLSDNLSSSSIPRKRLATDVPSENPISAGEQDKTSSVLPPKHQQDFQTTDFIFDSFGPSKDFNKKVEGSSSIHELAQRAAGVPQETKYKLKRSNSTSVLKVETNLEDVIGSKGHVPIINEYYSADTNKRNIHGQKSNSDLVLRREGLHTVKLRCRVVGAYFAKLGSKSFAVYSIAVSDADNNTWFVKRRYRNFERLHRHLKDIPNYTLHLPPKRIFSSSTEDAFVHQRCIQLDKYLQELLTIANVAEQHEVWDFLSASSKNYSFGKSPSVMRTLAVNVDDAVDDLVRQFKGVSDGLIWKGTGSPVSSCEQSTISSRNVSWSAESINKLAMMHSTSDSAHSISDNEEGDKVVVHGQLQIESENHSNLLNSDHELNSKGSPPMGVKHDEDMTGIDPGEIYNIKMKSESTSVSRTEPNLALTSIPQEGLVGAPPEWTPPNLSVPILNLVDKIFQLNRRGWLRRQVFWISKQILQLVMEDAIDDWLLRQIQWLRREDVIAQGIRWIQDVLWPDGVFFIKLRAQTQVNDSEDIGEMQQYLKQAGGRRASQPLSFEQQLEAARRANDVKQMLFNGAPTTLVSLIGHKQYRRCARDINYFLQSTVCLKQLGYGILELVLVSVFPELRDVVIDIHQKMNDQSL